MHYCELNAGQVLDLIYLNPVVACHCHTFGIGFRQSFVCQKDYIIVINQLEIMLELPVQRKHHQIHVAEIERRVHPDIGAVAFFMLVDYGIGVFQSLCFVAVCRRKILTCKTGEILIVHNRCVGVDKLVGEKKTQAETMQVSHV